MGSSCRLPRSAATHMRAARPAAAGAGPVRRWRLTARRRTSTGSSVRSARALGGGGVPGGADGLMLAGDAAQDAVDVGAVDGLAFQQQLGQPVQGVAMAGQHGLGPVLGLAQQLADLLVDDPLGRLRVRAWAALFAAQAPWAARGQTS